MYENSYLCIKYKTMKVNELRVGNFTYKTIDETEVARILPYDFPLCDVKPENYTPIPLTEEWLVKFAFEKDNDDNFELSDVLIQSWKFCSEFHYVNNHGCSNTNIKYVHQLQNLYFALTGEELQIKRENP